jgi:hypothetical protein
VPAKFADYPRHVVRLPDGRSVLVLVRRNIAAKYNLFNNWDLEYEVQFVRRLLRRDRRRFVELYETVSDDPGGTPDEPATRRWTLPDRASAAEFAERLCVQLARAGVSAELPTADRQA